MGLLQIIADSQTPIYLDSLAHASLWEGAHAARAPAHAFRHNDPEHLARMNANTRRLRGSLSDCGFPIHQGTEQIIALEAGSEPDAMVLRDALEARDVVGSIFCAPATSRNRAMVRLTLNS
jgi:CAI-1 autoinducer synthase